MARRTPNYGSCSTKLHADQPWLMSTSCLTTSQSLLAMQVTNGWLACRRTTLILWQELKQAFIDNFIATCEQPGNKYDLQRIRDRKDEPLREYVRRFSDMRIKVPSISDNEAIEAFVTGLRFHDALRDKLLRKRPKSVTALLATAKKYVDVDDAKKIIIEEAARVPRSDHPPTPR